MKVVLQQAACKHMLAQQQPGAWICSAQLHHPAPIEKHSCAFAGRQGEQYSGKHCWQSMAS